MNPVRLCVELQDGDRVLASVDLDVPSHVGFEVVHNALTTLRELDGPALRLPSEMTDEERDEVLRSWTEPYR